jgi:hypothetical protein
LKVLKIPPFGVLYKKIKIAWYHLHLTWKQEQDKAMKFQKRQVTQPQEISKVPPGYPAVANEVIVG